jgi:Mg2+/Co2+ transporter CorB
MGIVRNHHPRSEKDVILKNGELRDIDIAMDTDMVTDNAAIIDGRIVPDIQEIPDLILFSDDGIMAGFQVCADG